MVFGNNTASDISKLSKSGEWYLENIEVLWAGIIAKYYVQVMLLFVYNRSREIFGYTGIYVRNNLFTSMEEMIDSFLWNQYKPFKTNNMKQFNESNL